MLAWLTRCRRISIVVAGSGHAALACRYGRRGGRDHCVPNAAQDDVELRARQRRGVQFKVVQRALELKRIVPGRYRNKVSDEHVSGSKRTSSIATLLERSRIAKIKVEGVVRVAFIVWQAVSIAARDPGDVLP